jgi:hypothetical protein
MVSFKGLDVPTGIYLVSRLRFSLGPGESPTDVVDALPNKDFPRAFLQVTDQRISAAPAGELAERLRLLEEGREKVFLSGSWLIRRIQASDASEGSRSQRCSSPAECGSVRWRCSLWGLRSLSPHHRQSGSDRVRMPSVVDIETGPS